jgi:hypothetical protein
MMIDLRRRIALYVAATALVCGCAQPGPILSRRTTIGMLKTSVSHLEFENQQLAAKVAGLQSENREIENRFVEEERVNGDLRARLDNARNLLSDRGYIWDESDRMRSRLDSSTDGAGSRALPAGRSNRTPRKPPFARLPGRLDAVDSGDQPDDSRLPSTDAFGPQSWRGDDLQWLPIAQGAPASGTKLR